MKYLARYIIFGGILSILYACWDDRTAVSNESNLMLSKIQELQNTTINGDNRDSLLLVWKNLLTDGILLENKVNAAKANYQVARLYGMIRETDSATVYLEKAFELIEPQQGNLDEKARIYQGIGNISVAQGNLHKANYYYNKAAAIVLADSTVQLETEAKVMILVSAAQSNQQFHRLELALAMNRKALTLSQELPEGHINRQRPITQLIQTFYHSSKNVDSIGYYVKKLEKIHQQHPDTYDVFFVYESNALYYDVKRQPDLVLKYQLMKAELQEERAAANNAPRIAIANLFISYVNIAGLYTEMNKPIEAALYFKKASELTQEDLSLINGDHQIVYYQNLTNYYNIIGDNKQSAEAAQAVIRAQKELYSQQNTQAIAEMNSLYEIQAQERSIIQLNEHIRVNELELQQNRLWLIITALSVLILVILFFFFYYGFRQRRIRQEKDKVILEQQLLRTQMEPHFIFNTLTALQSYIRRGNTDEAIKYLNRFSKLLRNSLELSREQLVSIEEEIETLDHYLSLQKMRFEESFSYQLTVSEDIDIESLKIPPMLIQPFVENAILHGVDMKQGNGFVHVTIVESGDLLQVTIQDSGRKKSKAQSNTHRSLSGIITRERLALLGDNTRIETSRNADGGTTVHIYIPIG